VNVQIAIVGTGALGTLFGGLLARTDHEVWLLHHRESYVRTLQENGVRIASPFLPDSPIEVTVPATTDASEVEHVDLALVLVKAPHTRTALTDHAACIGPETHVLTLQNGLGCYETVREVVGTDRALGGVTYQGARVDDPGTVEHTNAGETVFGGADEQAARVIGDVLVAGGIDPVEVVTDPREPIWEKQLVGVAIKPVAALTRLGNAEVAARDDLVRVMRQLMTEAATVARAEGVDVTADDHFEVFRDLIAAGDHRSSMLQDVLAERPTEIDAVNGAVVELADEHGIAVPYNRLVTALVESLEASYRDRDPDEPG